MKRMPVKVQRYLRRIQLIGVGWVDAKPAKEFKAGDRMMFNYGYTYTVKEVRRDKRFLVFTLISERTGEEVEMRKRPDTLAAIAW